MPYLSSLPLELDRWQQTLYWQPHPAQQGQLQQLYELISAANRHLNLTRITDPPDFWEKHLWDSLLGIAPWLSPEADCPDWIATASIQQVIDIGTGGGFPGLPVAIACPDWRVTLLDATRKKIAFLADLSQEMGLGNVAAIADRAETLGHHPDHREQYDLALIRAVGPTTACAEYALPLLRPNGIAVLYRGQWTAEEATTLHQVIPRLGGDQIWVQPSTTPLTQSTRHCVFIRKNHPTATGFPRAVGIPSKQPL